MKEGAARVCQSRDRDAPRPSACCCEGGRRERCAGGRRMRPTSSLCARRARTGASAAAARGPAADSVDGCVGDGRRGGAAAAAAAAAQRSTLVGPVSEHVKQLMHCTLEPAAASSQPSAWAGIVTPISLTAHFPPSSCARTARARQRRDSLARLSQQQPDPVVESAGRPHTAVGTSASSALQLRSRRRRCAALG
jgi:hypothetical protein